MSPIKQAQLAQWPNTIFVTPEELARLCELHLAPPQLSFADTIVSIGGQVPGAVCYVIPRIGIRPYLGIRFSVEPSDYASFS